MAYKLVFTTGTIERIDSEYLTLTLQNNDKVVYKATITDTEACDYLMKYNNIELIETK